MKLLNRSVLFVVLITLISLVGCSGGGGSATPIVKDVAGINSTISGFMSSVVSRDSVAATKFLAAETTSSESSLHTIMVYDFGSDINDPNDVKAHYPFTVSESDIFQPTDSIATVKAYYKLSSGQPLWLTFALIKESGVWIIETITVGDHTSDSSSGFLASTYFPIIPGAISRFNHYYMGSSNGSTSTQEFLATPVVKDGMNFYRLSDVLTSSVGTAIRAQSTFSAPEIYYSQQSCGLWVYSPSLNDGVPFKFLETLHAFGSSYSQQYTSRDTSSNLITHTNAVSFGYPETAQTDMGPIQAVPVTILTTTSGASVESTSKVKVWFAANYGQVLHESFMNATDSEATYVQKIFSRTTPSTHTTNPPTYTSGSIIFAEGGDPAVAYDLYAGIDVNSSTGEFTLRNDGQGPTLIFQTPPSGPFSPTDEIEIFPDVTVGTWNWYPSVPSGYTISSSGNGIIVNIGTTVNCSLRHSTGMAVTFSARVDAANSTLAADRRTGDLILYIANFSYTMPN